MPLHHNQLLSQLQKELSPLYILSGEEVLLVREACDAVRDSAKKKGVSERLSFQVNSNFDWMRWLEVAQAMSLLSAKQLLELHLNIFPHAAGVHALQTYVQSVPNDKILLITIPHPMSKFQQTAWFQALLKIAVWVNIWPVSRQQLPTWIMQRLAEKKLRTNSEGLCFLADYSEGHLLAVAQEIEKLHLLYQEGYISPDAIKQAITDCSRFNVFHLVDAALQKEPGRVLRILKSLKNEGAEPLLVLSALTRALRQLASIAHGLAKKESLDILLKKMNVWEKQKATVRSALQRCTLHQLHRWLRFASQIDAGIKGVVSHNSWDVLEVLSLALAGLEPIQYLY